MHTLIGLSITIAFITLFGSGCSGDSSTSVDDGTWVPSANAASFLPLRTGNWWIYKRDELDSVGGLISIHKDSIAVVSTLSVFEGGGVYLLREYRDGQLYREYRCLVAKDRIEEPIHNFWSYEELRVGEFADSIPSGVVFRHETTWTVATYKASGFSFGNDNQSEYALMGRATRTDKKNPEYRPDDTKVFEDPPSAPNKPGYASVTVSISDTLRNVASSETYWDGYTEYSTLFTVQRSYFEGTGVFAETFIAERPRLDGSIVRMRWWQRMLVASHTE